MVLRVSVDVAASPEATFRFLADPRNRPSWQSSLRRVEEVSGAGTVGTTWTDVTSVGARPRMAVTVCQPYRTWAERGTWRGVVADLTLRFVPVDAGTRLEAAFAVQAPGLLRPLGACLRLLAPRAIRADLRRAARLVESRPG